MHRSVRRAASLAALLIGLTTATPAQPRINAIVNSASYTAHVGEGSLASIMGAGLAAGTCTPPSLPIPRSLCGATVWADGQALPILFASPGQLNVQLPYGSGKRSISVRTQGQDSNTVGVYVIDRAPGIFTYRIATPDRTLAFSNLAAAQLNDYTVHAPTAPVIIGKNSLALYVTGLGTPTNGTAPSLGSPAPLHNLLHAQPLDVYINDRRLPAQHVLFAGYAPGLLIHQVNILPPGDTPSGANTLKLCAGNTCSAPVTVFMADTTDYIVGSMRHPGSMTDGKQRSLETITGTATSQEGTRPLAINRDGNFLVAAKGTTSITLNASNDWESYRDTLTADGPTIIPSIPLFPRVVYNDVKGTYNREGRVWDNPSYFNAVFGQWRGPPGGGEVNLFDVVHSIATTNGTNPECRETVNNWAREDFPIKIYIDPTGEQRYNPVNGGICPLHCDGQIPANAVAGTEALWQELKKYSLNGGPALMRTSQPPRDGEHAITIKFDTVTNMAGYNGFTATFPFATNTKACGPITHAIIRITENVGSISGLGAIGRHELSHAIFDAMHSPFLNDNIGVTQAPESARDFDGRKMVEFLGYGVDLSKYAK